MNMPDGFKVISLVGFVPSGNHHDTYSAVERDFAVEDVVVLHDMKIPASHKHSVTQNNLLTVGFLEKLLN